MAPYSPGTASRPPSKPELAAIVMLAVFFGGMMLVALYEEYSVFKLSVPLFLVSWAILLFIHELGHALMAKWLGWRVEKISIGTGKLISQFTILGMPTELRAIPLSGFVIPRPANLAFPRLKCFLIFGAGPGVEIGLALLIWLFLGSETLFSRQPIIWLIALQSFGAAAVFGALVNLVPLNHQTDNGKSPSDGLGMILAWIIPEEQYEKWLNGQS
ncbi:MAG: site-2 protease family protein [Verrucomicrobiales bacterium]|nr:site-2 protease family protein [Verrucomicrobiales bacterium]